MLVSESIFIDGIYSVTAMCFHLLMPLVFLFVAFLSWECIIDEKKTLLKKVLFVFGITILLLDGVYFVYLVLSYPYSGMAKLYLSYRKEVGIVVGLLLLGLYGYRLFNVEEAKKPSSFLPFLIAALAGILLTSTWAPCIRESIASISQHQSGRIPLFLSYVSGTTLPFLLLSLAAFGLKFLPVKQPSARRFSTIGIILLILLSLIKMFMG